MIRGSRIFVGGRSFGFWIGRDFGVLRVVRAGFGVFAGWVLVKIIEFAVNSRTHFAMVNGSAE